MGGYFEYVLVALFDACLLRCLKAVREDSIAGVMNWLSARGSNEVFNLISLIIKDVIGTSTWIGSAYLEQGYTEVTFNVMFVYLCTD